MIKPAAPATVRNKYAPCSSYCDGIFPVDAGSGVNLANLARAQFRFAANGRVSINDDGTTAPTWGSDAEGAFIDFATANTRGWIYDNSGGGSPKALTEGGGSMRFSMGSATTGSDRPLFQTGQAITANNTVYSRRLANSNTIQIVGRDNGGVLNILEIAGVGWTRPVTLAWVFGLYGMNAWAHFWDNALGKFVIVEASVAGGNPKLLTQGFQVPAGAKYWLGYDPGTGNHGGFKLYGLTTWTRNIAKLTVEGPRRNWHINDVLVDPHIAYRTLPSYTQALWNNTIPLCGRVTRNSVTFETAAAASLVGTVYVDVQLSDDLANLDARPSAGSVSTNVANASLELNVTGLASQYPPGELVYRRNRWSTDGVTWYPFPAGYGQFRPQRTAGAYDVVNLSDPHVTIANDGGTPDPNLGGDLDIIFDDSGTVLSGTGSGRRKYWAAWLAYTDVLHNTDPDFTINGHDFAFCEALDGTGDIQLTKFDQYARGINFSFPVWKVGMAVFGLGNHEGEDANTQSRGGAAVQKGATIARKAFVPNPRHDTYPEGGENWPRSEWIGPNEGTPFTVDAAGVNASPLENAYAFHWSGGAYQTLWVFLDAGRYNVVDSSSWPNVTNLEDGRLGDSQEKWLDGLLRGTHAPHRIVDTHSLPGGGFAGQGAGGDAYYKRGCVSIIDNPAYFATRATVEPECQKRFSRIVRNGRAILSSHHDHRAWAGRRAGLTNVVAPTTSASSHTFTVATPGWSVWSQLSEIYGNPQSGGTLNEEGQPTPDTIGLWNCCGYTVFEIRADGVYWKVRETYEPSGASPESESDILKYSRPRLTVSRMMSQGTYAKDGSNRINLADALNPDPLPKAVSAVFDVADVEYTDAWWDNDYGSMTERVAAVVGTYAFDQRYTSGTVQLTAGAAAQVRAKWTPRWLARLKLEPAIPVDDPDVAASSPRRARAAAAQSFRRR